MSEHLLHAICDHYMLWLFTDATTGVCTLLYLKELWAEGRLIRWLMTGKAFNCAVSETSLFSLDLLRFRRYINRALGRILVGDPQRVRHQHQDRAPFDPLLCDCCWEPAE